MLRILSRYIISKKISHLNFQKKWARNVKISNLFRPVNYSNIQIFRNLSSLQRKHALPYACGINFRSLHNETEMDLRNSFQKFENLLRNIEEDKNDLSVDEINSYFSEMTSLLDDLSFEEHHGVKVLKDRSIIKLFNAVDKSIEQMPAKSLISALNVSQKLYIPFNVEVCCKMISKLNNSFQYLSFVDKVHFYLFLLYLIRDGNDETVAQKLANDVGLKLYKEVKTKVYLNSPEDTAAALCFVNHYRFITKEVEENILRAVLDLKNWDHSFIFKYFLKATRKRYDSPPQKDLYDQFFSRLQKEANHNYLHYFLRNYVEAVERNLVEYDSNLVDSVIGKLLTSRITTVQIRKTLNALLPLRHSHDGLVEYLICWLKTNPYIFVSHPILSYHIIGYIASFNNFSEDGNQLSEIQSVLRENSNLLNMLKHINPDYKYPTTKYLYSLVDLASLEVYIDEELINLSNFLRRRNIQSLPGKLQSFLLNLNQAVQLFHTNFETGLLSSEDAMTAIIKIAEKNPGEIMRKKMDFLQDVGSHLKVASREHNCLLTRVTAKPSYRFDGIVAVNNEGQFYDFGEYHNKNDGVFLEDISAPEGFKLFSLLVVFEGQFAKNSLCLNAACRLKIKIQERLGLPTVVLSEPIWNNLCSDEKGNYLSKMILEKLSKRNSAENSSDIAQSLES